MAACKDLCSSIPKTPHQCTHCYTSHVTMHFSQQYLIGETRINMVDKDKTNMTSNNLLFYTHEAKVSNFVRKKIPILYAYVHIVFNEVGTRAKMSNKLRKMTFTQIHQPTHSWRHFQNYLNRIKCNLWKFRWSYYRISQSKLEVSTLKRSDFLGIYW